MKQFRTDRRVWLIASGCLFLALSFVGVSIKNTVYNLWDFASMFLLKDGSGWGIEFLIWAVFWSIPAIVFGWITQAFIVVVRDRRRTAPKLL